MQAYQQSQAFPAAKMGPSSAAHRARLQSCKWLAAWSAVRYPKGNPLRAPTFLHTASCSLRPARRNNRLSALHPCPLSTIHMLNAALRHLPCFPTEASANSLRLLGPPFWTLTPSPHIPTYSPTIYRPGLRLLLRALLTPETKRAPGRQISIITNSRNEVSNPPTTRHLV